MAKPTPSALASDFSVPPNVIIEYLNALKVDPPRLFAIDETVMVQTFCLQRPKETLHRRIVPTISFTTHGRLHAITGLQCAVGFTAILTASI